MSPGAVEPGTSGARTGRLIPVRARTASVQRPQQHTTTSAAMRSPDSRITPRTMPPSVWKPAVLLVRRRSGHAGRRLPGRDIPSHLRAQGTGFAAAFSRIGAASGTFLLPIGIAHWGVGPSVLVGAVLSAIGLLVTYLWAPETANISLTKTCSLEQASPPPPTPAAGAVPPPT
jgi:hypothetical protein